MITLIIIVAKIRKQLNLYDSKDQEKYITVLTQPLKVKLYPMEYILTKLFYWELLVYIAALILPHFQSRLKVNCKLLVYINYAHLFNTIYICI